MTSILSFQKKCLPNAHFFSRQSKNKTKPLKFFNFLLRKVHFKMSRFIVTNHYEALHIQVHKLVHSEQFAPAGGEVPNKWIQESSFSFPDKGLFILKTANSYHWLVCPSICSKLCFDISHKYFMWLKKEFSVWNLCIIITSNKMDKALIFPFPLTASSKLENWAGSKQ